MYRNRSLYPASFSGTLITLGLLAVLLLLSSCPLGIGKRDAVRLLSARLEARDQGNTDISLHFSREMDEASVEGVIQLFRIMEEGSARKLIALKPQFLWQSKRILILRLPLSGKDKRFSLSILPGGEDSRGEDLHRVQNLELSCDLLEHIRIVSTEPSSGEAVALYSRPLELFFSDAISREALSQRLVIEPNCPYQLEGEGNSFQVQLLQGPEPPFPIRIGFISQKLNFSVCKTATAPILFHIRGEESQRLFPLPGKTGSIDRHSSFRLDYPEPLGRAEQELRQRGIHITPPIPLSFEWLNDSSCRIILERAPEWGRQYLLELSSGDIYQLNIGGEASRPLVWEKLEIEGKVVHCGEWLGLSENQPLSLDFFFHHSALSSLSPYELLEAVQFSLPSGKPVYRQDSFSFFPGEGESRMRIELECSPFDGTALLISSISPVLKDSLGNTLINPRNVSINLIWE